MLLLSVFLLICLVAGCQKYDYKKKYYEGLALVGKGGNYVTEKKYIGGKYGFVDENDNIVIPIEYDSAMGFKSGLACVKTGGKWGMIDKSGKAVVPIKYDKYPRLYYDDNVIEVEYHQRAGLLDLSGKEIVPPLKYSLILRFIIGPSIVKDSLGNKYGFIDNQGKEIIPLIYDNVSPFLDGKYASVGLQGKWGIIDTLGKKVIPCMYEFCGDFREGLAPVKVNDKFGFIDINNKMVIKPEFDNVLQNFTNDTAKVILGGIQFNINKAGKTVTSKKKK